MRESYDPAISAALEHAHPMQTIHGLKPHPEGYLLVADCGEALKDDLPEAFDREILPRLRETVEKDNCLQNWVVDYHGRGMMFVEDPDQCDMFLYSCLQDIRKISYCTPVTARAIDLLERFGGKREIRALGMLAAYAGASGGRYAGSVDVVADPTPAWRRIWGMYFPDLSENSG